MLVYLGKVKSSRNACDARLYSLMDNEVALAMIGLTQL